MLGYEKLDTAWDGAKKQILIKQEYTKRMPATYQMVIPYFKIIDYIQDDDKPVIAIYRTTIIPNLDSCLKYRRG
ncbi:glycoside hydrolase family 99-like domain-containing protein [Muribaculum gordoncarteri]|uniref:glycoside hydrolase family 99-like domain-containing protein n=1 Tax=Muribaculum gordoncarteri TaxID=2530390 RepID=UPI003F66FFFF